jgi:hypothetical protein
MDPSRYVRVEGDRIELFTPLSQLWLRSALGVLATAAYAAAGVIADTGTGRTIGWVGAAPFGAAPVSIAANALPISVEELIDLIEERCARSAAPYPPPGPD